MGLDYSSLIYIAIGVLVYLLIKRVSDSSALNRKVTISYNRREADPPDKDSLVLCKSNSAGCSPSRRLISAKYVYENVMMNGTYAFDLTDLPKYLHERFFYDFRGYGSILSDKKIEGGIEVLSFNETENKRFMNFLHSFDHDSGGLLFLNLSGYLVIKNVLLR